MIKNSGKFGRQQTLKKEVVVKGIGTHTGEEVSVSLKPAGVDFGIQFSKNGSDSVKAAADNIFAFMGCTVVGTQEDNIKTIEHLMATFNAMKIDNCLVEVSAGEIPIFDGSAKTWVDAILEAGVEVQDKPRKVLRVLKRVEVVDEKTGSKVSLEPVSDNVEDLELDVIVDFTFSGEQGAEHILMEESFVKEVAFARTFIERKTYEQLKSAGLVVGAVKAVDAFFDGKAETISVGVGIEEGGEILNPEGLRDEKEFARHKMLDSIGDLYSLGYQIIGKYVGYKPGHTLNNLLCKKLMEDSSNFEIIE
ncbi:MAG: UDP-3-O-acyl-N-acetylglucosamine deacetylase [Alphaproteobacteria bacterium]|jgi:UDP-3-O-[3-hydroxymyristoyl] N-acetylglucosamine deacetylase|nr:UDP-3-O-acyl-N-acetylglucosamine deacetylase [Alphaproteobacteria bacterium]